MIGHCDWRGDPNDRLNAGVNARQPAVTCNSSLMGEDDGADVACNLSLYSPSPIAEAILSRSFPLHKRGNWML